MGKPRRPAAAAAPNEASWMGDQQAVPLRAWRRRHAVRGLQVPDMKRLRSRDLAATQLASSHASLSTSESSQTSKTWSKCRPCVRRRTLAPLSARDTAQPRARAAPCGVVLRVAPPPMQPSVAADKRAAGAQQPRPAEPARAAPHGRRSQCKEIRQRVQQSRHCVHPFRPGTAWAVAAFDALAPRQKHGAAQSRMRARSARALSKDERTRRPGACAL